MARFTGTLLVDTNVILECHRIGAWRALSRGYTVETVEDCVVETQTGFQRRKREEQIDNKELRASLAAVHDVADQARAVGLVSDPLFATLDLGEQSLWAHALGRKDVWMLCGPDKASMRFGIRCGFRDKLVALERLLKDAGYNPKALKTPYTTNWLDQALHQIVMLEGKITP